MIDNSRLEAGIIRNTVSAAQAQAARLFKLSGVRIGRMPVVWPARV